jgi:hypothetical protein
MTTNRIKYRLPDVHEPTPEEIERAMRRCERLRAQACRDVARAVAMGLTRAFRAGAPAHRTASEAPAV